MDFFRKVKPLSRAFGALRSRKLDASKRMRACTVEALEERRLMAADIRLGMVYYEDSSGRDEVGDTFEMTWAGGAPGTQLTQIVIDTDKEGNGLSNGDPFFDIANGGLGAYNNFPLNITSANGFQVTSFSVADGGTKLIFNFSGFDAGERLVFTIDVDEFGFDIDVPGDGVNAVVEGAELQGSKITGFFTAPHFFDISKTGVFRDAYDPQLIASGLNLPPDSYSPPNSQASPVYTAGAFVTLTQIPLPIKISGTVFEDHNLNNAQDSGDQGIANVTLTLFVFDGSTYVSTGATTTTNANGEYVFNNVLPGKYRVVETQPGAYFSVGSKIGTVNGLPRGAVTSEDILSEIEMLGGEESIRNDFAEAKPASISGYVYLDDDNDGNRDPGEQGIAGVTVTVIPVNVIGGPAAPITLVTNTQGFYQATGLRPGAYRIVETQPTAYLDGLDRAGNLGGAAVNPGDEINAITLLSGEAGVEYNFGELLPARISGKVFADVDGDCILDPGELRLSGVKVHLLDAAGNIIATTTTNDLGEYEFTGLRPGTYGVLEETPAGYFDSGDMVGSLGGVLQGPDSIRQIDVTSGDNGVNYDFCEIQPACLAGNVYVDSNNNGLRDPGERGIAGVTLQLLDANGQPTGKTTVTDENGAYAFKDLLPGTYCVVEVQPNGFLDGLDAAGSAGGIAENPGDKIKSIVLDPNENAIEYNFGELEPASLAGRVFADRDNDCIFDEGELPLAGVLIELLDANGQVVATTVTDGAGNYAFVGLRPGTYSVRETQPLGYYDGGDMVGSAGGVNSANDLISQIQLGSGVNAVRYDFCEIEPASIRGRVHADVDGDCIQDEGEVSISGVKIELIDANGNVVATTFTDANGEYVFDNLLPGKYAVRESQPAGWYDGGDVIGSEGGQLLDNDLISEIDLAPGVNGVEYNFCEVPPGRISGYVFQDGAPIQVNNLVNDSPGVLQNLPNLRDGLRTLDDTPLAGVRLQLADGAGVLLLDSAGNPIETVTDANGFYQFNNLPPGLYAVIQAQPAGYFDSLDTAGVLGGFALNPGFLSVTAFAIDTTDAIAMIPLGPGQDAIENNFSEIVIVELPPPVENPPPRFPFFPPELIIPNLPVYDPPAPDDLALAPAPLLIVPRPDNPLFGGGSAEGYTWHLSVVNAGLPRAEREVEDRVALLTSSRFDANRWDAGDMKSAKWTIRKADGTRTELKFGPKDGIPVTGDFNGDGITDIGVYVQGHWFLDLDGDGVWDEDDLWARLGSQDDLPTTGDWDGDGKTDIAIFGKAWEGDPRAVFHEPGLPAPENFPTIAKKNMPPHVDEATNGARAMKLTAHGKVRADLIDHVFHYGTAGDMPVAGDWKGAGVDTIGVFREGNWTLDDDGDGKLSPSDLKVNFGQPGDRPIVGDWDGDGMDSIGVFRGGEFLLDSNNNHRLDEGDERIALGGPHSLPVSGDWDGDGTDEVGVYESEDLPKTATAE